MVLFSGDGDFRSLVEAMQRRGVRVTVVSTISTQPPMVADELRRQADIFLDIVELQPKIGRDPAERAAREPREPRGAPYAAVPAAQHGPAACRRRRAPTTTISTTRSIVRCRRSVAAARPGRDCPLCPRLKAFRDDWRGRKPGWFNAPVAVLRAGDARLLIVGLAPGLQGANRTGRPFTGDYAGDLLYATLARFGFARGTYQARSRRRPRTGRRPHRQRGALRAAGEQAAAGRDQRPAASSSAQPSPKCRSCAPS